MPELRGRSEGLQLAFLVTVPAMALDGLVMLFARRTYQPDIAAAAASNEVQSERSAAAEGFKKHPDRSSA